MNTKVYRIEEAIDLNTGETSENSGRFIGMNVAISHLEVGVSAFLDVVEDSNYIRTSTVKSFSMSEDEVVINTRNTSYLLIKIVD